MRSLRFTPLLTCLLLLAAAPHFVTGSEETPLSRNMEAIGDAFKPLYRGLTNQPDSGQIEQYLGWTRTINENATKAREHTPALAGKMSGEERDTLVKNFTTDMEAFIKNVEALEKALLAGNLPQAQELVKKLKGNRHDGHEKYQEEEE